MSVADPKEHMTSSATLAARLTREHHEIDCAIEAFIENVDRGSVQSEQLAETLDALRRHIYLEEVFLFPPFRGAGIVMPIFVMMREHGQLWRAMDALTDLLDQSTNIERLRSACVHLLDQLFQHNSKEEPIIYSGADTELPPQTRAELTRFIETGRIPDGWVCQQAGG